MGKGELRKSLRLLTWGVGGRRYANNEWEHQRRKFYNEESVFTFDQVSLWTLSYNNDPGSQKTDVYLRDFNILAVFKAMETNGIHSRILRRETKQKISVFQTSVIQGLQDFCHVSVPPVPLFTE